MYDELSELYDLFIDWPTRLATEMPLLRDLGVGGQLVVDAACGTGQHARALAEAGSSVIAYDASPEMIAAARESDPAGTVEWRTGPFRAIEPGLGADALMCIGTSLPHVSTRPGYRAALKAFRGALAKDGLLVVHSRNLLRATVGGERFLPPIARETPDGTVLFWRFYGETARNHVDFNIAILRSAGDGPAWTHKVVTTRLCVVDAEELSGYAKEVGLRDIRIYGHLDGRRYNAASSPDLVLTARRRG